MKKKKFNNIFLMVILFLYVFFISYFKFTTNDDIWNYGFSYNFANGLAMYKDYNMVITPLYPLIFGCIMKLFGINIIVFYLFNALIPVFIFYLVNKYYKKSILETIAITSIIYIPNYNILCILFLVLLIVLEDKKSNDFFIGFILGLIFLTKSSMGLLLLVSFYYIKDTKKIVKRLIGFIIPNLIILIYFYFKDSIKDYFNYAFGSLVSFGGSNLKLSIGTLVTIIIFIYLIREFKKTKDIKVLYILLFQIMSFPIFNIAHILYSLFPLIIYLSCKYNNKIYNRYRKLLVFIIITPLILTVIQLKIIPLDYGTNALKYKLIKTKYINDSNIINKNVDDLNNTYFIMYEAYYYKLLLDIKINKYDLTLKGNMGYNGEEEVIKHFDSLPSGTQFLMHSYFEKGQASEKIYNHIKDNYLFYKNFNGYNLYIKQ